MDSYTLTRVPHKSTRQPSRLGPAPSCRWALQICSFMHGGPESSHASIRVHLHFRLAARVRDGRPDRAHVPRRVALQRRGARRAGRRRRLGARSVLQPRSHPDYLRPPPPCQRAGEQVRPGHAGPVLTQQGGPVSSGIAAAAAAAPAPAARAWSRKRGRERSVSGRVRRRYGSGPPVSARALARPRCPALAEALGSTCSGSSCGAGTKAAAPTSAVQCLRNTSDATGPVGPSLALAGDGGGPRFGGEVRQPDGLSTAASHRDEPARHVTRTDSSSHWVTAGGAGPEVPGKKAESASTSAARIGAARRPQASAGSGGTGGSSTLHAAAAGSESPSTARPRPRVAWLLRKSQRRTCRRRGGRGRGGGLRPGRLTARRCARAAPARFGGRSGRGVRAGKAGRDAPPRRVGLVACARLRHGGQRPGGPDHRVPPRAASKRRAARRPPRIRRW